MRVLGERDVLNDRRDLAAELAKGGLVVCGEGGHHLHKGLFAVGRICREVNLAQLVDALNHADDG